MTAEQVLPRINIAGYIVARALPLPASRDTAYDYILAGNGVFLRAENRFVRVCLPIMRGPVRGLVRLTPQFSLKVPLLPARVLDVALADARRQYHGGVTVEALYHVHYAASRYRLAKPPQRATPGRVASHSAGDSTTLLELHSHSDLPAFFSATDNRDEQGFRFYAVLGRVRDRPEACLRLGVYGYHFDLPLTALFSTPNLVRDLYHTEVSRKTQC